MAKHYFALICKEVDDDITIDEHLKMNDNFLRTGPYKPKKK